MKVLNGWPGLFAYALCMCVSVFGMTNLDENRTMFFASAGAHMQAEFGIRAWPNLAPSVGVYGTDYAPVRPVILIEYQKDMIQAQVPPAILSTIASIPATEFFVNVLIPDDPIRHGPLPNPFVPGATVNIVTHAVVGRLLNTTNFFDTNIGLGVFDADGVGPAAPDGAAFNATAPTSVIYHEGPAFSPNNARFTLAPGRCCSAVSFWLLLTHGGHAVVSFNVLVLGDPADFIETCVGMPDTQQLGLCLSNIEWPSADARAIDRLLDLIAAVPTGAGPAQPARLAHPVERWEEAPVFAQLPDPTVNDASEGAVVMVQRPDGGVEVHSKIGQHEAGFLNKKALGQEPNFVNHDCSVIAALAAHRFLANQYGFQRQAASLADGFDLATNALWGVMIVAPEVRRLVGVPTGDLDVVDIIGRWHQASVVLGTPVTLSFDPIMPGVGQEVGQAISDAQLAEFLGAIVARLQKPGQNACALITGSAATFTLCHGGDTWAFIDSHLSSSWTRSADGNKHMRVPAYPQCGLAECAAPRGSCAVIWKNIGDQTNKIIDELMLRLNRVASVANIVVIDQP